MTTVEELIAEGERLMAEGSVESASGPFQQALTLAEQEHGPDHEVLILPLWWLAKAAGAHEYGANARTQLAVQYSGRAAQIADKCWQSKSRQMVGLLLFHSTQLWINENIDDALATASRAEALLSSIGDDVRIALRHRAEILMFADRGAEGLVAARKLLELEIAQHGIMTWYAHYLVLNCLRLAGHDEEALSSAVEFLEREGEGAASPGWKDVVRPMVNELEERVRAKSGSKP